MRLDGQTVDPALRYCTRCGAWEYLTGHARPDGVPLTASEHHALAALETQLAVDPPTRPDLSTGGDNR